MTNEVSTNTEYAVQRVLKPVEKGGVETALSYITTMWFDSLKDAKMELKRERKAEKKRREIGYPLKFRFRLVTREVLYGPVKVWEDD